MKKQCFLGSSDKVQLGRWVIKVAWCGSGACAVRQGWAMSKKNFSGIKVSHPAQFYCLLHWLCPQTKGWEPEEISEKSYRREFGVKSTLTAEDVGSSR